MWKVKLNPLIFSDDFKKIDRSSQEIILKTIKKKLSKDPEKYGEPLSGDLKGYYKLKISMFRTIYRIDKDRVLVFVIKIGFRRNNEAYLQAISRLQSLGLL